MRRRIGSPPAPVVTPGWARPAGVERNSRISAVLIETPGSPVPVPTDPTGGSIDSTFTARPSFARTATSKTSGAPCTRRSWPAGIAETPPLSE
jgi:hypothetical protein